MAEKPFHYEQLKDPLPKKVQERCKRGHNLTNILSEAQLVDDTCKARVSHCFELVENCVAGVDL